jgi:hypothetical protein
MIFLNCLLGLFINYMTHREEGGGLYWFYARGYEVEHKVLFGGGRGPKIDQNGECYLWMTPLAYYCFIKLDKTKF